MNKLHAIEVFAAIAEHGSMTQAANRLGRSLPTVVRTLAQLEQQLGVRLFHRSTRKIALTDEGRVYLDHCTRMLSELNQIEGGLRGDGGAPAGLVHITAPLVFGEKHVAPAVSQVLSANPDLRIRLLCVDRIVDLVEEHIDIAIRIDHLADSTLMARRAGALRRVVCASPAFLDRVGAPSVPGDLRGQPCCQIDGNTAQSTWSFVQSGKKVNVRTKGRLICNTVRPAIDACVNGLGYGWFFEYQVVEQVRAGRLAVVLEDWEQPPVPVHLVYSHARLLSPRVRAVLDELAEAVAARLTQARLRPADDAAA